MGAKNRFKIQDAKFKIRVGGLDSVSLILNLEF